MKININYKCTNHRRIIYYSIIRILRTNNEYYIGILVFTIYMT